MLGVVPSLKERVYHHATGTLGFDDCRFADPRVAEGLEHYKASLAEGHITLGDYKAAIKNYEQLSLLDPTDRHSYIKRRLEWLRSQ